MSRFLVLLATLPVSVGMCQDGTVKKISPPTRLDVIMTRPHPLAACDQMGGKLVRVGRFWVCRDVDY